MAIIPGTVRILSLLILAGFFMALPFGVLNYLVMPQLNAMKDFYQNAGEVAEDVAYDR